MPATDPRSTTALRRTVAAATSFAVAVSAIGVPVWSPDAGVRAAAQTEVNLGATATKDSLGGGGWLGTIRLADGDYTPRTVRSVRLNFGPNAGAGLKFNPEDTYDVQLAQGTRVLQNFGTLTGRGGFDAAGNRWLDVDLPEDVTLRDQQALQIRKAGAANSLPIRAGLTAQGPTATGYPNARFSPAAAQATTVTRAAQATMTVTPTATVTTTPITTAATTTVTHLAPAATTTPSTYRTTTSTISASATTTTRTVSTTVTPTATRTTAPTVTVGTRTTTQQVQAVTVTPTSTRYVTPTETAPTETVTYTAPTVTVRAQTATVTPVVEVVTTPTVTERATKTLTQVRTQVTTAPTTTVIAPTVTAAPRTVTSTPTVTETPTVTGAPKTAIRTVPQTVTPTTAVTRRVTTTAAPRTTTVEVTGVNSFDWDRAKVKPGEVAVVQPSRAAGAPEKVRFATVAVEKRAGDGATVPVAADESWISVQEDGTLVLTPPPGTAEGVYEVRLAEETTGETDTVTVVVAPAESMAQRYAIKDPETQTPAGVARAAAAPRAHVTEGGVAYPDRALPRGTAFAVDFPGAEVDGDGRVTYAPPVDTPPGVVSIPVAVTFPDGSRSTYHARFVVGTPLMAARHPLAYEAGVTVPAGNASAVLLASGAEFPEGTTFALRNGAEFPGWSLWLDERTGALKVIAPSQGGGNITVPVVAYFTDGSTQEIAVPVGVAGPDTKAAKQAAQRGQSYDSATGIRGERVTLDLNGNAEAGTTFRLLEGPADTAVDTQTGQLAVRIPQDAVVGEPIVVKVRAMYDDNSAAELAATINVADQATLYPPRFDGSLVQVGGRAALKQTLGVPAGTRFEVDFAKDGWNVSVDANTGEVKVTTDSSVPHGDKALVPVKVTYPDGSSRLVAVPVTATRPVQPQVPEAVEPDGSSIRTWLPILIGALVAIGATGYAVWLNQDALLAAMGIRV